MLARFPWFSASLLLLIAPLACSAGSSGGPAGSGGDGDGDGSGDGDGDDICLVGCGDGDGDGGLGDIGNPGAMGVCGDGMLAEDEVCDDGGEVDGDGCAADCLLIEPGFICREPGTPCAPFAKCGDGLISFPEQCDDGNALAEDGCSATCKIEIGSDCMGEPSTCFDTECGNGTIEGAELCDDGNTLPFDGCSVDCQLEPQCMVGAGCTSTCGDGIVLGEEQCDDANDVAGDGCSSDCKIEPGYECPGEPCETINGECVLRVPAILRDLPLSHPDVSASTDETEIKRGNAKGMVEDLLDADGKPVPANTGEVTKLEGWYRDFVDGNTGPILHDIILFDDGMGNFVNRYQDDGTRWMKPLGTPGCQAQDNDNMPCPLDGNPVFFPLDDIENPADTERFGATVTQEIYGGLQVDIPGLHNFHFTTEVTYWFVYDPAADAELTFIGDDDVWVFLNGRLAVDIGDLHVPKGGRIRLGATEATVGYTAMGDQSGQNFEETTRPISDFGLMAGQAYEIKVFHAERQTTSSTFQLNLAGFDTSRSDCTPECGDGIIGVGEECDDGDNDGGYNECQEGCVLGGYCGDGIVQEQEVCDDRDPNAPGDCQGCRLVVVR